MISDHYFRVQTTFSASGMNPKQIFTFFRKTISVPSYKWKISDVNLMENNF
jgi:hypothetical protein